MVTLPDAPPTAHIGTVVPVPVFGVTVAAAVLYACRPLAAAVLCRVTGGSSGDAAVPAFAAGALLASDALLATGVLLAADLFFATDFLYVSDVLLATDTLLAAGATSPSLLPA